MKKALLIIVSLFSLFLTSGCLRRLVTIDSLPQGAQVYFDRKLIGQTPCSHEFLYYGVHHLELVKDDCANFNTAIKLNAPVYEYFPLSVFSEILTPWQISDQHSFTFKLEQGETRKPIISPIEQPQPALPTPRLERLEEKTIE